MAYSDLDAFVDQWLLRPPFSVTDSLSSGDNSLSDLLYPVSTPPPQPSQSITGSDHETSSRHKRSPPAGPATGRIVKRKPRTSKKSQTTFITADPSNFRQMVQEVTGVNFPSFSTSSTGTVVKPQLQRSGLIHSCLPTLDTAAFLLNHQYGHQMGMAHTGGSRHQSASPVTETGGGADFDGLVCFPILESWKVM